MSVVVGHVEIEISDKVSNTVIVKDVKPTYPNEVGLPYLT